jgi:hypothetical protein
LAREKLAKFAKPPRAKRIRRVEGSKGTSYDA